MEDSRPVIIVKKKVAHGGHHGGAWKVAYADFVTAMMALFIVLWLMNLSKPVREAIAGYFNDPAGTGNNLGTTVNGAGDKVVVRRDDMGKLKQEIENAISQIPDFDKLKSRSKLKSPLKGSESSYWNLQLERSLIWVAPSQTQTAKSCLACSPMS